jgi:hypothetical protein
MGYTGRGKAGKTGVRKEIGYRVEVADVGMRYRKMKLRVVVGLYDKETLEEGELVDKRLYAGSVERDCMYTNVDKQGGDGWEPDGDGVVGEGRGKNANVCGVAGELADDVVAG